MAGAGNWCGQEQVRMRNKGLLRLCTIDLRAPLLIAARPFLLKCVHARSFAPRKLRRPRCLLALAKSLPLRLGNLQAPAGVERRRC